MQKGACEMRKKTKKITQQAQLKVRTGLRSGQWERCQSDADCPNSDYPFCIDTQCVMCRSDADCPTKFYCDDLGMCWT